MHLSIIAGEAGPIVDFLTKTLAMLENPALVLLLMSLAFEIYYFIKQIKEKELQIANKELQIKELHNSALESSIQNLKIIHEISTTIDKNDERGKIMENLLRENNSFLKSISKALNL